MGIVIDIPNIYYLTYWYLKHVPRGRVVTYGDLAEMLGDLRASRTVGRLMAINKYPDEIPCYKVVHRDGNVGKYSMGVEEKIKRLIEEGIPVEKGKIKNFKKYLLNIEKIPHIPYLKSLQRIQEYLSTSLELHDDSYSSTRYVISTDVSYLDGLPDIGIGVAVLFECEDKCKLVNFTVSVIPIFFPYIPTYLAFRELPPLLSAISELLTETKVSPDLYIVDGHGVLHPRCFGIASHLGILLNKPTIGLAKSKLVGKEGESFKINGKLAQKIIVTPKCYGYFIKAKGKKKGYYVSPGNKISAEKALEFISKYGWSGGVNNLSRAPHIISTNIKNTLKAALDGADNLR